MHESYWQRQHYCLLIKVMHGHLVNRLIRWREVLIQRMMYIFTLYDVNGHGAMYYSGYVYDMFMESASKLGLLVLGRLLVRTSIYSKSRHVSE